MAEHIRGLRASHLIATLQRHQRRYGDLPILGGQLDLDSPPTKIVALDAEDCDVDHSGEPAVALFFEA